MTKNNLQREGFILFTILYHSSSSMAARVETPTIQEHGVRSWCRGLGGVQLTGLLFVACSPHLLIEHGTTSPAITHNGLDSLALINH